MTVCEIYVCLVALSEFVSTVLGETGYWWNGLLRIFFGTLAEIWATGGPDSEIQKKADNGRIWIWLTGYGPDRILKSLSVKCSTDRRGVAPANRRQPSAAAPVSADGDWRWRTGGMPSARRNCRRHDRLQRHPAASRATSRGGAEWRCRLHVTVHGECRARLRPTVAVLAGRRAFFTVRDVYFEAFFLFPLHAYHWKKYIQICTNEFALVVNSLRLGI